MLRTRVSLTPACHTRPATRRLERLRCHSSGGRQQDFDLFGWGANWIKKLGGTGPETRTSASEPTSSQRQAEQHPSAVGAERLGDEANGSPGPAPRDELGGTSDQAGAGPGSELEERKLAFRHLSRTQEVTEEWPPEGTPTWHDWTAAFQETLAAERRYGQLSRSLTEAMESEDYASASTLKSQMDELTLDDELSTMLEEYAQAIHDEDFKQAASLRDFGGVGLLGWWWPQSTNAENPNHILRVVPGLNRYIFLAYDPSDLAQIHGVIPKDGPGMAGQEELQYVPVPSRPEFDGAGMPVMELFFQRFAPEGVADAEIEAELTAQAVALRYGEPEPTGEEASASKNDSDTDVTAPADDGEAADSSSDEEEVISVEGISLADPSEQDSSIPIMHISVGGGSEPSFLEQVADATRGMDGLDVPDFPPSIVEPVVQRVPAVIQKFENDRDRFLVHILPSPEQEAAAAAQAIADPDSPTTAPSDGGDEEGEAPQVQILHRHKEPGKQEILTKLVELAKDKGIDLKQGVSIEVRVKGRLENRKLDYKTMADEIVKGSGSFLDAATVAEILKDVFDKVGKGRADGKGGEAGLKGAISYKRIPVDSQRVDPFTGIYVGSFGGHGPEILQLQRSLGEDGKEYCEATKLTGDVNVPAGNTSFRAAVSAKQRLQGYGFYPPELNVTARYKGQGRIAEVGYKNASWVDGELLQFGSGQSDFARGAELGFLWNLQGDQKHLSLLHRLTLDDTLADILDAFEEE